MLFPILAALAGHASFGSAVSIKPRQSSASAYCSNSNSTYQLSSIAAPVQGAGSPGSESTWQLSIDDTSSGHKQTIVGFGAAVTDATVSNFNSLPSSTLDTLLSDLMTTAGADFSLMRHSIGASDLSPDPAYTYDDNNGSADTSLSGFELGSSGNAMASLLAQMKSVNSNLNVLGTPWSAPGWMKLNDVIDGDTTNNNLNDGYPTVGSSGYSSEFADYFVKYIQAYEALGATINAITIQNEPLNSQSGYPTMYVYADESAALIENYVGPALASASLSTEIWAYDHNTDVPSYPQTVISSASKYVNTVAWHCYASSLDWDVLTQFHDTNPDVAQYMTECWTPSTGAWNQAANFTIGPLQNWAVGVMAWTLGTDSSDGPHLSSGGCSTCTGLVVVNDDNYELQISYYMMAQFSKFIPRGAIILNGTGSYSYSDGTGIQSIASVNPDGTRSVVIMNTFGNDVYVSLNTTSGEEWSGNIPTESVVTWVLPAAS